MRAGTNRRLLVALALLLGWLMVAPDGITVVRVRVAKKEGDTITLRMPFGTMDVKEAQVELLDAATRLIRLRDTGETSNSVGPK